MSVTVPISVFLYVQERNVLSLYVSILMHENKLRICANMCLVFQLLSIAVLLFCFDFTFIWKQKDDVIEP